MAPAMRTTTKMSRKPRKLLTQPVLDEGLEDRRPSARSRDGQDEPGDDRDEADDLPDEALEDADDRRHDHDGQQDVIEPVHAAPPLLARSASTMP